MSCGDLKELVSDVMDSCHVEVLKSLTTRNGMNILGNEINDTSNYLI